MFPRTRRALPAALLLILLAACSGEAPQAPAASSEAPPASPAAPAAPAITDEAELQAAAAKALSEQRFYAPAGESALDYYLALRELRPDDANLATALLELLPYAVIGIEQAVARQELAEARRLVGLLERADPQAPSLPRLRDSIVAAEASAADEAAEALAKAERDQAAMLAAEQAAQAQAATAAATAPPPTTPAPSPKDSAPAATPAPAQARPRVAAPTTAAAVPAATAPAVSAVAPATSAGVPRLLSAPSPRYPIMAQRRKLEGQVVVQFTIQPDGSVASPRVVSADPPGVFDEAALVAASRWRFETGSRSVPSSRVVQFRLAEAQR